MRSTTLKIKHSNFINTNRLSLRWGLVIHSERILWNLIEDKYYHQEDEKYCALELVDPNAFLLKQMSEKTPSK